MYSFKKGDKDYGFITNYLEGLIMIDPDKLFNSKNPVILKKLIFENAFGLTLSSDHNHAFISDIFGKGIFCVEITIVCGNKTYDGNNLVVNRIWS